MEHCFQTKNLTVLNKSICSNINTNNLIVKNNINSTQNANLNIKNEIIVKNNTNLNDSNIMVFNNCNIYKIEHISNQNYVVLPNNNLKYNVPNSLMFNSKKNTIEAYYDNKWRTISHLFNCDYNTYIDLNQNIDFYQNNDLTFESNVNNITINKNTTNIYNNLNIESGIFNNIAIYKNLNQYNSFKSSRVVTIPMNSRSYGKKKQFRYNTKNNLIEYYSDKWKTIELNYLYIVNNTNTLHILHNNNKITINSNTTQFYSNMNIEQNINIDNLYISKNINVNKDIIFNNNVKLKNNNNTLECISASNYNNNDLKLLKVDENVSNNSFYYNYDSHYIYLLANYDTLKYCSNEYHINHNLIVNSYSNFIYHIFSTNDIFINKMEFQYYVDNTNINNYLNIFDLKNIKNHFHIIIYLSNTKVVYDSESDIVSFMLKKNNYYTIKLKIKDINNNPNKNNTFILFKLKGYYHNNFLFDNQDIEFLYNVDSSFFNNITFSNMNSKKLINFKESLNCNTIKNIKNIYVNKSNIDTINSILKVNDVNYDSILNITNNYNVFFGNTNSIINNCSFIIKNKFNNDSLYVSGNSVFNQNTYINNDLNIENNCIISNKCDFKSLQLKKLSIDNISFNNTITCYNLNINNIYLNYNKNNFNSLVITNIINNNKIYNLDNLINHNVTVDNKYINYNNKLYINYDGNLNINSNESFNKFSIGTKLNPNISVSFNGDTNINTNEFYLNNINIIKELNILKSNI